jgi:hypothetical protein
MSAVRAMEKSIAPKAKETRTAVFFFRARELDDPDGLLEAPARCCAR